METFFWIIRHGQTDWNVEKRLQGWRDIPLNETGFEQANVLSSVLENQFFVENKPDLIYASDLQRAIQTATPIAQKLAIDINIHEGLRERNYGDLEGINWDAFKDTEHIKKDENSPAELSHEKYGSETLAMLHERVSTALEELAQNHQGKKIMLVSHGGSIDMIWRYIKGLAPNAPREIVQKNTSINLVKKHQGTWHIIDWANANHVVE